MPVLLLPGRARQWDVMLGFFSPFLRLSAQAWRPPSGGAREKTPKPDLWWEHRFITERGQWTLSDICVWERLFIKEGAELTPFSHPRPRLPTSSFYLFIFKHFIY